MEKCVFITLTQTTLNQQFVFPCPYQDIKGVQLEYITSNAIVNPTQPYIAVSCSEIHNMTPRNMSFLLDHYEDILWIQPFPIPLTLGDHLKFTCRFTEREIKLIGLNLKPTDLTFGPGGYILWNLKFYF